MTLYELTGEFLELLEMAEDENLDQETINDTLEGIDFELEEKADCYAKIIKALDGDIASIKSEIDRLTNKKQTIENNIKYMKQNLEQSMIAIDKKKFKTQLFSFNVQKNAPSLEIIDETKIPENFYIKQEPKLDKKSLLAYVKENDVNYATIKQTESLRIR